MFADKCVLTHSTHFAGIMVMGTRVRDLLPRATAKVSKQVDISDVILKVDNLEATPKDVLTMLRGVDQGSVSPTQSARRLTVLPQLTQECVDSPNITPTLKHRVSVISISGYSLALNF